MKQLIEQTLGNSLRCILPSYWWKRLLNKMAERVAAAEASAASALRIVSSALNDFSSDINSLSSRISAKQDKLTSGSNIKTINGQSILGSGNIEIKSETEVQETHTDIVFYINYPVNTMTQEQRDHNAAMYQEYRKASIPPAVSAIGTYSYLAGGGTVTMKTPMNILCLQSAYFTNIPAGDLFSECITVMMLINGTTWEADVLPDGRVLQTIGTTSRFK